jgi:hypothetical protein
LLLFLAEAEEAENEDHDDNQSNDVDDIVHFRCSFLAVLGTVQLKESKHASFQKAWEDLKTRKILKASPIRARS